MTTPSDPAMLFTLLGGEDGVRQLVDRFYDLMDTSPEAAHIRQLHATSLRMSREKLFLFLTGWAGGPQRYVEKYGHPRLRMRHFPFAIASRERDEWLWCMNRALDAHPVDEDTKVFLRGRFRDIADHMRNQPDPGQAGLPILND